MKKRRGKVKGSENERNLCKVLSKWWTGKDKPIVFWRVGSSGATFTITSTTEMAGDVVAVHQDGISFTNIFVVETKFVKNFDILDLLYPEKKTNQIENWWDQVTRDSSKINRIPLLIFKRNRLEYLFMTKESLFDKLKINKFPFIINKNRVVGRFEWFLNNITRDMILNGLIYGT